MISKAMRKAVKQAGKQQEANTRGLSGNRNSQGDFMTGENQLDTDRFAASEMMARDKMDSPIEGDLQNYIDDAKEDIESLTEILDQVELMDPTNKKEIKALMDERDEVIKELYHYLEINDIATPREIRDMLDPLTKTSRGEGPIS